MLPTLPRPTTPPDGDQGVGLRGVDWKGYRSMLRIRGDRGSPRITYLDGWLWLESFSFGHERLNQRLGRFVMEVVTGLEIPCTMAGRTAFFRRSSRCGVEGDQSYYIANQVQVRGKRDLDLRVDPPPDLVVEAVYGFGAEEEVEAWRRLGVPEVWVCSEAELTILVRRGTRRYGRSHASATFPWLFGDEILDWMRRPLTGSDTDWSLAVRRWVQDVLAPRRRPADPD